VIYISVPTAFRSGQGCLGPVWGSSTTRSIWSIGSECPPDGEVQRTGIRGPASASGIPGQHDAVAHEEGICRGRGRWLNGYLSPPTVSPRIAGLGSQRLRTQRGFFIRTTPEKVEERSQALKITLRLMSDQELEIETWLRIILLSTFVRRFCLHAYLYI
jgi:hypothetical protein